MLAFTSWLAAVPCSRGCNRLVSFDYQSVFAREMMPGYTSVVCTAVVTKTALQNVEFSEQPYNRSLSKLLPKHIVQHHAGDCFACFYLCLDCFGSNTSNYRWRREGPMQPVSTMFDMSRSFQVFVSAKHLGWACCALVMLAQKLDTPAGHGPQCFQVKVC